MKISVVGPSYPLRGGISHHVYWLQRELSNRGHEIQVISYKSLYPGFLFPGKTILDESSLRLDSDSVPLLSPLSPASWLRAFRTILKFSPDLVLFQWWNPFFAPLTGTLARWLRSAGIELAIECHNVFPHERHLADLPLLAYAFGPFRTFFAHSGQDCRELLASFPDKQARIIPLPHIPEFKSASLPSRAGRRILFFGIVRKYKGLQVLLEAMSEVLKHIECKLLIAGEFYEPESRYRDTVRQLGIEEDIDIINRYIPNEEVARFFEDADLLVLPYLSASQSGVAQTALANCLPVIASRTGGLIDSVKDGENGFLVSPGDAGDLADKIVKYFVESRGPAFAENMRAKSDLNTDGIIHAIESSAGLLRKQ